MGNSLLDFVMALVRDPEAAARYAADPAAALADAQLSGVTITDVQNLIPVVTDSLAMATPGFGALADPANVWTSGAAAAAFDAFDIPLPAPVTHPPAAPQISDPQADRIADMPDTSHPGTVPDPAPADPILDQSPVEPVSHKWGDDGGWQQSHDPQVVDHHPPDHPGFDLL
jgi:hypothetical protein